MGCHRSTDAGKTWTHLGLRESQMIAMIDVDPKDPNRLFVAVLGHPDGPNAERGIFGSTDGGATFQRVLYRDEYTSGSDVRIDPNDPSVVYASLWRQQESFIEGGSFGAGGETSGIFQVHGRRHDVAQADGRTAGGFAGESRDRDEQLEGDLCHGRGGRGASSSQAEEPWRRGRRRKSDSISRSTAANTGISRPTTRTKLPVRRRVCRTTARWHRIGGGDAFQAIVVDPNNSNVVYSASTVFWRTEDAGITWSAVRGAPGGDDYQKAWVNPADSNIILLVSDRGGVVSANRGASLEQLVQPEHGRDVSRERGLRVPYRVCSGQRDSGSACVPTAGPTMERSPSTIGIP